MIAFSSSFPSLPLSPCFTLCLSLLPPCFHLPLFLFSCLSLPTPFLLCLFCPVSLSLPLSFPTYLSLPIPLFLSDNIEYLVNSTLLSMAATVRTDTDRSVVLATLESLEDLVKALKSASFRLAEEPLESLAVSIQDILEQKVTWQLSGASLLTLS